MVAAARQSHTIKRTAFTSHPHVDVDAPLRDVEVDGDFPVLIPLPEDAALALLDLGRLPGRVQVIEGDQSLLYVRAGPHLLGGADQHPHRPLADLLEQSLLLGVGVGVGVAGAGDLIAGDAAGGEFGCHLVVHRVPPGGG